jgi:hypothetical protein
MRRGMIIRRDCVRKPLCGQQFRHTNSRPARVLGAGVIGPVGPGVIGLGGAGVIGLGGPA